MAGASTTTWSDYPLLPFFGASVLLNPVARAAEHFDVPGAFVGGVIILAAIAVAAIAASVRLIRAHPSRRAWCALIGWSASVVLILVHTVVGPFGESVADVLILVSGVVVLVGSFARGPLSQDASQAD